MPAAVEWSVMSSSQTPSADNPVVARLQGLLDSEPRVSELGSLFADAGFELALVGGPVRDALLGRGGNDWDLATSARPDDIERLVKDWADAVWGIGREFGTIGCRRGGAQFEITTYRSDEYDPESRKPAVVFGDSLEGDLSRRDFTVNAMALRLDRLALVDPFGGLGDLGAGILRTPVGPEQSFSDDPLRMLRAARFSAQLDFAIEERTLITLGHMRERLSIVSPERIRDEFDKLVCSGSPRRGLQVLVDSGLAEQFLPELSALQLEIDEHHRHKDVYEHSLTVLEQAVDLEHRLGEGPDLIIRLAALLHDIGKPKTRRFQDGGSVTFHHHDVVGAKLARKRMRALRYSNDVTDAVCLLIELHLRFHGYGDGEWTDAAVRRYVRDAGDQLTRLHVLTRADCTTRNQRKAARLRRHYDHLEQRIDELAEAEELAALRPDLDGQQIMAILGLEPGPIVGQAYRHLLDLRIEHGPMDPDEAERALRDWYAATHP